MARPFLFVHIPKTGGSTFRHWLRSVHGHHGVYFLYEEEEQERHLRSAFESEAPAICGHVNWHVIENAGILSERPFLFTMVRKPQDQIISHYLHRRRGHKWKDRQAIKDDFNEFLSKAWSNNWQSAFLSGLSREHYLDPPAEELKEMAMANLRKMDLVASTAQLKESTVILRKEFHWKKKPLEDRNITKEKHIAEVLHEEFDKKLKEMNKADHSIYRYCKGKMQERWDELPFWKKH